MHGDKISVAPERKILPAAEFCLLQSGVELLEYVKRDAEQYRAEVVKEGEQEKEAGYQAGYAEGFQLWSERIAALEEEFAKRGKEMEKSMVPLALTAARKIVGKEIALSENVIVDIVASSLKSVAQHKKIAIYVNKKDFDVLEKNKPRLREVFESLESFSIRARDDISPGGCVIETEIGIVNAQEEHRWQVLEKAFEKLALQDGKQNGK